MRIGESKFRVTTPWLSSARNDVALFFAPGLAAVLLSSLFRADTIAQSPTLLFLLLQGFGFGPFHQGLTWFQYFDRNNLSEYAARKNFFWAFVAPTLILVLAVAAYWLSQALLIFVYVLWTIQHIAKQNVGILLLYHNHDGDEAIVDRDIEIRSLETSAAMFSFLFLNGFVKQEGWIALAVHLVIATTAIELIWLLIRYASSLVNQLREGRSFNAPAFAFWTMSLIVFVPFALAKNYGQGLFVALVVHWFQYVGLNAILVKRKYSIVSNKQALIGHQPLILFCAVGVLFAALSLPIQLLTIGGINPEAWQLRIFAGLVYGFTLSHYFLDAFIWRFRDPFNRTSILTYLKPPVETAAPKSLAPLVERELVLR